MALTKTLGGSGGSAITAKDEGSTLTTAATSFDFVGRGLVATNVGGAVTLTADHRGRTLIDSNATGIFTSIPGTFDDLLYLGLVRGTNASTTINFRLRFNSDTGNNYDYSDENRLGTGQ